MREAFHGHLVFRKMWELNSQWRLKPSGMRKKKKTVARVVGAVFSSGHCAAHKHGFLVIWPEGCICRSVSFGGDSASAQYYYFDIPFHSLSVVWAVLRPCYHHDWLVLNGGWQERSPYVIPTLVSLIVLRRAWGGRLQTEIMRSELAISCLSFICVKSAAAVGGIQVQSACNVFGVKSACVRLHKFRDLKVSFPSDVAAFCRFLQGHRTQSCPWKFTCMPAVGDLAGWCSLFF